jgi:hypothetical protein
LSTDTVASWLTKPSSFARSDLDRPVIDIAVADVEIEQLIEILRPRRFTGLLSSRRGDDETGD